MVSVSSGLNDNFGKKIARLKLLLIDTCQAELPKPPQVSMGYISPVKDQLSRMFTSSEGENWVTIMATAKRTTAIAVSSGTWFTPC